MTSAAFDGDRPRRPAGPTVVFYVSGHGFGHASRDIEVLNALAAAHPDVAVAVRTSAPKWLFDLTCRTRFDWRPGECDTGIVQLDSLRLDVEATLRAADAFHRDLHARAAAEAAFLRSVGAALVVSDIPALGCAAADAAGMPCIALGNFTWDWIYASYAEAGTLAPDLVPRIREAYATAELALRLPLHGGFEPFAHVEDVPFIARRATRSRDEVRARFALPPDRPLVLASFGGYGLEHLDLSRVAGFERWMVVTTSNVRARRRGDALGAGPPAGGSRAPERLPATVRFVDERDIYAAGFRYEDLVASVDVVATKPGYGIIAECVANGTAMLYTARGAFPEYDVMVREMPRYLRCAYLSNDQLYAGHWEPALDAILAQPAPPERPRVDGAEIVAASIARACRARLATED